MSEGFPPELIRRLELERFERDIIRAANPELFDRVTALLFRHDPMGINFESNTDEYEAETGTILRRMPAAATVADVERIVIEEFDRWFEPAEVDRTGMPALAEELWSTWLEFRPVQ